MKRIALLVALCAVAGSAVAATVVLKGGKKLEVARWEQRGNLVIVSYANGRVESYPLNAVDLAATRATEARPTVPEPPKDTAPHSPFFKARATPGAAAVAITDANVRKVVVPEESPAPEATKAPEDPSGQVTLQGYDLQPAGDGGWTVTATLANVGTVPVQGLNAGMRAMDNAGKLLGSASAAVAGVLEPGKTGTATATVAAATRPTQVAFDLTWQVIRPTTRPVETPSVRGVSPKSGS